MMTLIGGESLLNDATALTAYKVALAASIGTAATWQSGLGTFALAAAGGVVVGGLLGQLIAFVRQWFDDPMVESAIGLVAPFAVYFLAEEVHGSGVIAVVVAALILGQRSSTAGYATRLQDGAVWRAVQLVLESFAFLLIGLQLPTVIGELVGIRASTLAIASVAVLATVIGVRLVWVYAFAFGPRMLSTRVREREERQPTAAEVFIVAWAGMRGVVSLAAAFAVPLTTISGEAFPGRPQLVFLTFVVVVGTLLLHGLTLPWLIKVLDVQGDDAHRDTLQLAAAQTKAAAAASARLDELVADQAPGSRAHDAAEVLRGWTERRQRAAWERLGRGEEEIGESPAAAFKRLRLAMLAAERATFIAERDAGRIGDEVLRSALGGLDLEEASLNRN
jgi:CPA1 family monovalent cation:H+ antiporter